MRNGMEDGQLVMLPPLQINQIIDGGGDADELTFLSAEVFYTRNSSETLDKDKKSAKQIVVSESHEETNFRIRHQYEKCSGGHTLNTYAKKSKFSTLPPSKYASVHFKVNPPSLYMRMKL